MIDVKFYDIDLLKVYILQQHGGVYLDVDFHLVKTFAYLHRVMDLYTGNEGYLNVGVTTGVIAVRKGHQAI